jgi:hypothetical protein
MTHASRHPSLRHLGLALMLIGACNPDPGEIEQTVDYRVGLDGGTTSGERGSVKITEVLWSGSVQGTGSDAVWDPTDVFLELRNEGVRGANVSGWHLTLSGVHEQTWRIPATDFIIPVGGEMFIAAKTSGCFPAPDLVIPDLMLPQGDPFRLTLRDADERLMEPMGSKTMPPFAGGYDFVSSRSMERINLMFGGQGSEPRSWHFYNEYDCPNDVIDQDPTANVGLNCFESNANNDKILPSCRAHTLASPGRPNSPDYSGAYASGGFE